MGDSGSAAKKLLVGVVALGLLGLTFAAFRYSRGRGRTSDAEREANRVLIALAAGMAKCALNSMPAAGAAVPAHLAEVSGKPFSSRPSDWQESAFACSKIAFDEPQLMQYRWERQSESRGRVFAVGDLNADKIPDKWFEIAVVCTRRDTCTAPNYITEVLEDGVREPPAILRWVGRAHREVGEPPSLAPDAPNAPDAPSNVSATINAATPSLPAFPAAGMPAPLDQIFYDAERLAIRKMPGAQLISFEAKGLQGRAAAPGRTLVEVWFGQPNGAGFVAKGEPMVSVSFGPSGLTDELKKAPRELHRVLNSECTPEHALDTLQGSPTLSLIWDGKRERSVWLGRPAGGKPMQIGATSCAVIK